MTKQAGTAVEEQLQIIITNNTTQGSQAVNNSSEVSEPGRVARSRVTEGRDVEAQN